MNSGIAEGSVSVRPDSGLQALCAVAGYYRIPSDPLKIARELAIAGRPFASDDLVRAAKLLGLKARVLQRVDGARLARLPTPSLVKLKEGGFVVFGGLLANGLYRLFDPATRADRAVSLEELAGQVEPMAILVARHVFGSGIDPRTFGFQWFLPSILRYRKPLGQVLLGSLFIQIFALVTPLFFQIVIDKVLTHKGYSTLFVLVIGLVLIGLFDVILQYLRTYALSHTTNRIDVELGMRLYRHLLRLPIAYFETRAAGQTVARVRELETIRAFLTGQGLFSALDLVFASVLIAVLFAYSWPLALIVVGSIPFYVMIGFGFRPALRELIKEKFNRGAESQQFLVESVVGIHTLKAAAVEPFVGAQWEEKLAAYVRTAFQATMMGAKGQTAIQYVSKLSNALLLLFGAKSVIDGTLTVGELVAFNMLAGQVAQPVLRLSQLWQDFQQVQISVERLGDILNMGTEPAINAGMSLPPPKGAISFKNVTFRYRPGINPVLRDITLDIQPGEVIGIVGASGSGKSTLAKLIQRFYIPEEGQVLLDGADLSNLDPAWLRSHIGVVLQESILFNRTIHNNIALANPVMPRAHVTAIAKLSGADEFIVKLPQGYDTMIEERGANLSGGQRQRIAIARALAVNPPILIFDEATSALDYESERVIQVNMRSIVRNRTVIIIAHRLAAVRDCNRIVGMADGRIVEVGSHDELLKRPNGLYASLWALQSERVSA
jgi:ATP-binding cassette, subfamily B, bacterial HlyB/CyaB